MPQCAIEAHLIFGHSPSNMTSKSDESSKRYTWKIVWINVFLLGTLHALAVYGYWLRAHAMLKTIIFAKCIGILSSLGVTAGAHRLWSHKTYNANIPAQILLAMMMTLTYQNSIYIWSRDHRLHHKYTETDADPHNAKRGFFFSHVGWLLVRKQDEVKTMGKNINMSDLQANKIVMFQHKYYYFLVFPWAFGMPALVPWYFWGEPLFNSFLCSITTYVITVNLTWCINSLAHLNGDKPFDKNIGAVQNVIMQYIGIGEGFHNYHHTFPWDYRASEYGFEGRNITTGFIDLLAAIGWVTHRKTPSKEVIKTRAQRTGDGSFGKDVVNNLKSGFYFILFLIFI